jgi:ABC-type multidrug transport system permease subunit
LTIEGAWVLPRFFGGVRIAHRFSFSWFLFCLSSSCVLFVFVLCFVCLRLVFCLSSSCVLFVFVLCFVCPVLIALSVFSDGYLYTRVNLYHSLDFGANQKSKMTVTVWSWISDCISITSINQVRNTDCSKPHILHPK